MTTRAGAPAWMLVVSGVLMVLYSVLYALWTASVMILPIIGSLGSISDGSNTVGEGLVALLVLTGVPLLQLLGFLVTGVMGLLTAVGGLRLNVYRSKGIVWLGVLCSVFAPILALLVNAGSALNIGSMGMGCITGCLLGNIPTLLLLVLGLGSALAAGMHVSSHGHKFA